MTENASPPVALGNIDEIDYVDTSSTGPHERPEVVPKGSWLVVRGWAALEDPSGTCDVFVTIDDETTVEALTGIARDDVAAVSGERFRSAGFRCVLPTAQLSAGEHRIAVAVRTRDGAFALVPGEARCTIDDSLERLVAGDVPNQPTTTIVIDRLTIDGAHATAPLAIAPGSLVGIAGWAFDDSIDDAGSGIFALYGSRVARGAYGIPRDDVSRGRATRSGEVGFSFSLTTDALPAGRHEIRIRLLGADGRSVFAGAAVSVDVERTPEAVEPAPVALQTKAHIDAAVIFDASGRIVDAGSPPELCPGDSLFVRGWAIDAPSDLVARGVHLIVDGFASTSAIYGVERTDVASGLGSPNLAACGFAGLIAPGGLRPGEHVVSLRVIANDGLNYYDVPERLRFTVAEHARAERYG